MQIQYNKEGGGSIIYDKDDWLAGMDTTSSGNSYGHIIGNPLMSAVDPLRKYGYVSPSFNPVDVTNITSITSTLINGLVNGNNAYFIGGDRVQKMTTLATGIISTTAPFPHTISHGAHTGETSTDIANYYTYNAVEANKKQCAFFSFYDDTDWDVGIYDYVADTFDDDFMSTIPTTPLAAPYLTGGKGFPHPLIVGDDDILYIGDRNFVHAYDQTTGIFSAAVLTLPKGWIITCFAKTQDLQLVIGTYTQTSLGTIGLNPFNRGDARAWFWSYTALDVDYSRDLRDNYVSEMIQWGGTIVAFTSGRRSLTARGIYKLQALNGAEFEVIKSWSQGGIPVRGGVDNVGNDIYWNGGGHIFAYVQRPENGQYILNNIFNLGSTGGVFKFLTATAIYHSSFGASTGAGLISFIGDYNETGTLQCKVATPIFPNNMKGDLTSVTIKFSDNFTGGRTFQLNAILDYSTSANLTGEMATNTTTRAMQILTRTTSDTPLGQFNTLQPVLIWNTGAGATDAPEIEYIKFDYQLINVDLN